MNPATHRVFSVNSAVTPHNEYSVSSMANLTGYLLLSIRPRSSVRRWSDMTGTAVGSTYLAVDPEHQRSRYRTRTDA